MQPAHAASPVPDLVADVDDILAHCGMVIEASRRLRGEAQSLQASIVAMRVRRRRARSDLGRWAPRFSVPIPMGGGAGALAGARVMLVTHDADLRDLSRILLEWYGATSMITTIAEAVDTAGVFRPDAIVVDLPFDRREAFALPARLRRGIPIVAVTRHGHDHPEHQARRAGFDVQMSVPLDPDGFEQELARMLRRRAA